MEWILNDFFIYIEDSFFRVASLPPADLIALYSSFLLFDAPRYVISKFIMLLFDVIKPLDRKLFEYEKDCKEHFISHNPPLVSILCPGKNERETMPATIKSILAQDYPNFELLVIDDGSTDDTWSVIDEHLKDPRVHLYRRQIAGGKSSAANMGMTLAAKGDILVIIDSDSFYEPNAITEIIKPFYDPKVGAVSGNLRVSNWRKNLITRFQAVDYLHSISLGRRLTSAAGTLAICSGAFGAFRRKAVQAVGGWDVGPGEDGDLTIKLRKLGYKIKFAPESTCYTKAPETWIGWWKQRRRWNRGVVRYKMRKHFDMALPWSNSFSFTNMLVVLDVAFFRIFLLYSFFIYFFMLLFFAPAYIPFVAFISFTAYTCSGILQLLIQLYYSDRQFEDFEILMSTFIMYPYRFLQKIIRLLSVTEEFFLRRSYHDKYVPRRVGDATIQW